MSNYIIIGGGWSGVSSTGDTFVRIRFKSSIPAETTLTMWKNKNRVTDKHPDYLIMAAVKEDFSPAKHPDGIF